MVPLKLTSALISQTDVARLMRELNGLNDFFTDAQARAAGTAIRLPKITRLMDQMARENKINLLKDDERARFMDWLREVHDHAPSLHISFAVEPSPRALETILIWMRQNIHPMTLLQVGLQPSIAAGCMLRSTNKVFDMSLRANLQKQAGYLTQLIQGAVDGR